MEKYLWSELNRTGVYFLLNEGVIVYIGKTTKYPMRIKYHVGQGMEFDSVRFVECAKEMLSTYEKRWIEKFQPINNTAHKKERKNALPKFISGGYKKHFFMKFRKLTKKSRIGFGTYKDATVERMFVMGKTVDLIQMYYNLSHITFFDEILTELKITPEWTIQKPGSDREKGRDFTRTFYNSEMVDRRERKEKRNFQDSKQSLQQIAIKASSRSYHQNKNQGH